MFGCDFLLSSSFEPIMVEINGIPSLARLKPGPRANTTRVNTGGAAEAAESTEERSSRDAIVGFNKEKESFMGETDQSW